MISITKSQEPQSLQHYRLQPGTVFDGQNFTPVKQDIREQLVAEQGYLCAYCMSRIEADDRQMKVEHWHSRKKYPEEQLSYANLLGCCYGNEGSPDSNSHCDTKKHDEDLLLNPAEPSHYPRLMIRYEFNGTVTSDNAEFDRQINDVLNLNADFLWLKKNRKRIWKKVTQELSTIGGTATRAQIEALLSTWQRKDSEGKLKEYSGVAIYYLNKKLQRVS